MRASPDQTDELPKDLSFECGGYRGVTEAACKTVFTQRLKNSGMRWSHEGAKTILTLRTILISRSWEATYSSSLNSAYPADLRPYRENQYNILKNAA
jgi:hypothetical protein